MTFGVCDAFPNAISNIEKCGSRSTYEAIMSMRSGRLISNEEALSRETRVMFIRNPLSRIMSCFSHFWWLAYNGSNYYEFMPKILKGELGSEQEDLEIFTDHILSNDNTHWSSQIEQLTTENGIFVPNRVHRFEDLKYYWGMYCVGKRPDLGEPPYIQRQLNSWSKINLKDYRMNDIREKFAPDFELWEKSRISFGMSWRRTGRQLSECWRDIRWH